MFWFPFLAVNTPDLPVQDLTTDRKKARHLTPRAASENTN